jgi:hypothetical protein
MKKERKTFILLKTKVNDTKEKNNLNLINLKMDSKKER